MLEAVIAFQAGARGELLPAQGPCKIKNVGAPLPPPLDADSPEPIDELANAMETDFNWYLTDTATEYIPDTDRMFFHVAFGGDGFKKLFHCPIRRRPVSESVEAEDLIVSNSATDLYNCGRVTHRIKMRRSVLRRMQLRPNVDIAFANRTFKPLLAKAFRQPGQFGRSSQQWGRRLRQIVERNVLRPDQEREPLWCGRDGLRVGSSEVPQGHRDETRKVLALLCPLQPAT
jgi:hypothetical protein